MPVTTATALTAAESPANLFNRAQAGTVTIAAPGVNFATPTTITITFPVAFPSTPAFVFNPGGARYSYDISALSTTGATVIIYNFSSGTGSATTGRWIAALP